MIYGIGTDIVRVSRMADNLDKHGTRFAERILSESEFERFAGHAQPAHYLAKRFAAKEAASKALGTGFNHGLSLHHIIVVNEASGRPTLQFVDKAESLINQLNITGSYLSLSDEQDYAVAFVVLETASTQA